MFKQNSNSKPLFCWKSHENNPLSRVASQRQNPNAEEEPSMFDENKTVYVQ